MNLKQAVAFLGDDIQKNGDLYDLGTYLAYDKGAKEATLDGEFSADYLEAIAVYMRAAEKETKPPSQPPKDSKEEK